MGFLCKFVSVIGEFQRSCRMPPSPYVIPFFMVFGGSTMGLRRQFVLLGCFKVCVVRHISSRRTVLNALFLCTARANLLWTGDGLSNSAESPFGGSSNCDGKDGTWHALRRRIQLIDRKSTRLNSS